MRLFESASTMRQNENNHLLDFRYLSANGTPVFPFAQNISRLMYDSLTRVVHNDVRYTPLERGVHCVQ